MLHPKQILTHYGLTAKKSLGQNFLFDDHVLAGIVAAAGVTADDPVLEIGPGLGALTHHLAQTADSVTAVELDQRFLPILQLEMTPYDNVRIIHGDILEQNPAELFAQPYKVVANVPYYITGAILRHLLAGGHKPTTMVLTVQLEVAERLTAVPGSMSVLAVSTQFYGDVTLVNRIKAGAFWPRPDVDSAVVRLDLAPPPFSLAEEKQFFRLVKAGFSQKRKQLKNNLKQLGLSKKDLAAVFAAAEIEPTRRAQTLSVAEWHALYEAWQEISGHGK